MENRILERVTRLEERVVQANDKLDHLDGCLDETKAEVKDLRRAFYIAMGGFSATVAVIEFLIRFWK